MSHFFCLLLFKMALVLSKSNSRLCLRRFGGAILLFGVISFMASLTTADKVCQSTKQEPRLVGLLSKHFVAITKVDDVDSSSSNGTAVHCLYDLSPDAFDSSANKVTLSDGQVMEGDLLDLFASDKLEMAFALQDAQGDGAIFLVSKDSDCHMYNLNSKTITTSDVTMESFSDHDVVSISSSEPFRFYSWNVVKSRDLTIYDFDTDDGQVLANVSKLNQHKVALCPDDDDGGEHVTFDNETTCHSDVKWSVNTGFTDGKKFYLFTATEVLVFDYTGLTSGFRQKVNVIRIGLDQFLTVKISDITDNSESARMFTKSFLFIVLVIIGAVVITILVFVATVWYIWFCCCNDTDSDPKTSRTRRKDTGNTPGSHKTKNSNGSSKKSSIKSKSSKGSKVKSNSSGKAKVASKPKGSSPSRSVKKSNNNKKWSTKGPQHKGSANRSHKNGAPPPKENNNKQDFDRIKNNVMACSPGMAKPEKMAHSKSVKQENKSHNNKKAVDSKVKSVNKKLDTRHLVNSNAKKFNSHTTNNKVTNSKSIKPSSAKHLSSSNNKKATTSSSKITTNKSKTVSNTRKPSKPTRSSTTKPTSSNNNNNKLEGTKSFPKLKRFRPNSALFLFKEYSKKKVTTNGNEKTINKSNSKTKSTHKKSVQSVRPGKKDK